MIKITKTSAICNLGKNLDEIIQNVTRGAICELKINFPLPQADSLRCNNMLVCCVNQMQAEISALFEKYDKTKIGIVIASTNTGIDMFEETKNPEFLCMSNPAEFLKNYLKTEGFFCGVSTACSSGIKAFITAEKLIKNGVCDAVIVGGTDEISKFPLAGFKSLEVLSENRSNPFSKNRTGMNISEAAALFILEKEGQGVNILGMGETSDAYHAATPEPEGIEAANAMMMALNQAGLEASEIDYINLHGTGTISNDLMEANAVYKIFGSTVPVSSTKPLTGHCLGAAASIETAICCALLEKNSNIVPPHIYDGEYDSNLPPLKIAGKNCCVERLKNIMCNAFGFGGTNAVIILGK